MTDDTKQGTPDVAAVRRRPGMYIGDVRDGTGLAHLVWEVLANAIDEYLAGRCDVISVVIQKDGALSIDDNGGGFPVHDIDGVPFTELALTRFHETPTLDGHRPHEHVASHGSGLCPVNALCEWLVVESFRSGRHYHQRFDRGVAKTGLSDMGPTERSGTRITFAPDPDIWVSTWFDPGVVVKRLRELSWLLSGLRLEFQDHRAHRFSEPRGLEGFLSPASAGTSDTLRVEGTTGLIKVEAAARWHSRPWARIESFANIQRTTDGGTHVRGLMTGLVAGLRQALPEACRSMRKKKLTDAVSHGLDAVVCVRLNDPEFGAPTRSRLTTPEVEFAVAGAVRDAFERFVREQPNLSKRLEARLREAG